MPTQNHHHQDRAFTLIELIVSISIVLMMLFLVNRIFFDTTQAVSRGIATSKVIANNRTISEQLENDFDASSSSPKVLGPADDGILIIINKRYDDVLTYDAREPGSFAGRSVRSDQLCFIRELNNQQSPIAGNSTSYTNSTGATITRVWYGHVAQTNPDGSIPSNTIGSFGINNKGLTGPDKFANQWVLGRQVLYFDNTVASSDQYADFDDTNLDDSYNKPFYYGYTDLVNTGYTSSPSNGSSGSGAASSGNEIISKLDSWRATFPTFVIPIQRIFYLNFLMSKCFIFRNNHLMVNTSLNIKQIDPIDVAQMHPFFVNNVSDFIVSFAGDYNKTDGYDQIDLDGEGNIEWYSMDNPPPDNGASPFRGDNTQEPYHYKPASNKLVDSAFIFRHDDNNDWPRLIRIQYRLHDTKGELLGLDHYKLVDQVDDDEDFDIDDYRNNHNDINELSASPGKLYEVILKVDRN